MGCLFCDKSYKKKYFSQSDSEPYDFFYSSSTSIVSSIPNNIIDIQNKSISTFIIQSQYYTDLSLGEGTFGSTIKIIDKISKKSYALKILPKELLINFDLNNEASQTQLFLAEKLNNLTHNNINSIKSIYENKDNFFILKTYLSQSLHQKIQSKYQFCENEIKDILYQILLGLVYLHDNGIIHGDVRSENVLFFTKEQIKLDNFGLYEKFLRKSNKYVYLYSSPELIENSKIEKIDEWGVGIIMYLLYCGKYPFNGNSFDEVCRNITKGIFDENSIEFKNISQQGKNLLLKLLTYNPKYRINVHDALKHSYFDNKNIQNHTYTISTENSFEINSNSSEIIISNTKQNSFYLTSDSLFDIDNNLNINLSKNENTSPIISGYDMNILIKTYFVFIIVFHNENEAPDKIYKEYFFNNQRFDNQYSDVLKLFMFNNFISYDENETDKNLIDYLSSNKIFLFGSNINALFEYFKEDENNIDQSNICFKNIIQRIKCILGKELEERMVLSSLDGYFILSEEDINKKMTIKEFRSFLNDCSIF